MSPINYVSDVARRTHIDMNSVSRGLTFGFSAVSAILTFGALQAYAETGKETYFVGPALAAGAALISYGYGRMHR